MGKAATLAWSLACIAGLAIAGSAGLDYWRSSSSRHWPVVEGQVVESALRHEARAYRAAIRYSYEVSGTRLVGTRVRFGPAIEALEEAQAAVTKFPAGKRVSVHFSPDDATRSVLEPGELHGYWAWKLGIGLILACVAGAFGLTTWNARVRVFAG